MYDYLSILIFLAVAGGFAVIFSGPSPVDDPTVRRHQVMNVVSRRVFDVILFSCFTILSYGFRNLFCFPYSIALPDIGCLCY
jgi:hypothetical protein